MRKRKEQYDIGKAIRNILKEPDSNTKVEVLSEKKQKNLRKNFKAIKFFLRIG